MLNDLMGELQLVGIDRSKRDAPAEVCLHMSLETTGMETLEGTVVASPQDASFTSKCAYLLSICVWPRRSLVLAYVA